jgi:hypothetical protein
MVQNQPWAKTMPCLKNEAKKPGDVVEQLD